MKQLVKKGVVAACFAGITYLPVANSADLKPLESQVARPAPKSQKSIKKPAPLPPAAPKPKQTSSNNTDAKPATKSSGMLFNFQDAEVKAVIKTISKITGKNFILDPRVKGKISIISAKPVSKTAAYQIFLSALRAQGFTTAKVNRNTLKIIPVGEGKQSATLRDFSYGGEQMVSRVVVIQHGTATQLVPLLRPLMAPTSQLSAYSPANALIITDYATNMRRLLSLVEEIDQPVSTDVTIIELQHASALDMADLISKLTSTSARKVGKGAIAPAGSRTSIVPDLRTNSLLVRSDNPGRVAQIKELVIKLDVPAKTDGNTRVIYLRNADAKKLSEILRGLLEASARKAKTRKGAKASSAAQNSTIQADEETNALIISASDAVYNNLRGVIDKLDTRRAQVFVEALIIEISADNASQFGFQWAGAGDAGKGTIAGVTNLGSPSILATAADPVGTLTDAQGLSIAYVGKEITLSNGDVIRGLGGLARALEDQSIGNILSTPNILTLDNAEAKIVVGQNVPFLTGSFSSTGGTGAVNPFQTIERKDVGLTLEIKPQITEGGTIKLEILSEVSSVSQATGGAQDLITNKRTLETTVVVDDGASIVLGGLIEDSSDEITTQVPILGRIPLLGWLFKHRAKTKTKTNLMVFLRPTIIRNPTDSLSLSTDRYDYVVGQQKKSATTKNKRKMLEKFSPAINSSFGSNIDEKTDKSKATDKDELLSPPGLSDRQTEPAEPGLPESS